MEMALILGEPDARQKIERKIALLAGAEERYLKLIAQKESFAAKNGVRLVEDAAFTMGVRPIDVSAEADRMRAILETTIRHRAKLAGLLATHQRRNLKPPDLHEASPGPTPEAAIKPTSRSSVLALVARKRLEMSHLFAANEIAEIVEGLDTVLSAKGMRLGRAAMAGRAPKGSVRPGAGVSARISDLHYHRYVPWTWAMRRRHLDINFVLAVVVSGQSVWQARHSVKPVVRHSKAVAILRASLDLYWKFKRRHEEMA